jgi:hypothetical protein
MQRTPEQISNEIVQMMQTDEILQPEKNIFGVLRLPIMDTSYFEFNLHADPRPSLRVKDQSLMNNFKSLSSQDYNFPKLLSDYYAPTHKLYIQWVTEEFGEEFGELFCKELMLDPTREICCLTDTCDIYNRWLGPMHIYTPVHIQTAIFHGKVFENDHPAKPTYIYDYATDQFTRCQI